MRTHDPLSYIDPRSRVFNGINVPIPVPMLMPAAPPPPPNFFNNNGQMMNSNNGIGMKNGKKFNPAAKKNKAPRFQQNPSSQMSSQLGSSQMHSQQFYKYGITQGIHTQNSQVQINKICKFLIKFFIRQ